METQPRCGHMEGGARECTFLDCSGMALRLDCYLGRYSYSLGPEGGMNLGAGVCL